MSRFNQVKQEAFRLKLLAAVRVVVEQKPTSYNAWIGLNKKCKIYIRVWYWHGLYRIDLANISWSPEYQKQGHFTALLEYLEATGFQIRVESIINVTLENFLRKRGYADMPGVLGAPTLIYNPPINPTAV
jgi:hypothetical protein